MVWALALTGICNAGELQSYKIDDQPRKVRIEFFFTQAADLDITNDFNANIISLKDPQLTFSREQLAEDHRIADSNTYDILRFLRFTQDEAYGEIRVYVGWKVTPADAQVIRGERVLAIEIIKPLWLVEDGGSEPEPDGSATVPESDDPEPPAPDDSAGNDEPAGDGISEPFVPGSLRNTDWPEPEVTGNNDPEPVESADPLEPAGEVDPTNTGPAGVDPAAESADPAQPNRYTPLPSYRMFDIDQVAVNKLEFHNQPFDQALMELVAGCGFNVVLGEGIDTKVMSLNFTQRELSLKRALDILSLAYDLSYSVEDDAIIIKLK